jgi:hypothetical protein
MLTARRNILSTFAMDIPARLDGSFVFNLEHPSFDGYSTLVDAFRTATSPCSRGALTPSAWRYVKLIEEGTLT